MWGEEGTQGVKVWGVSVCDGQRVGRWECGTWTRGRGRGSGVVVRGCGCGRLSWKIEGLEGVRRRVWGVGWVGQSGVTGYRVLGVGCGSVGGGGGCGVMSGGEWY